MPGRTKGGNRARMRKKMENKGPGRKMQYADSDGQAYGVLGKAAGDRRFPVTVYPGGYARIARVRGKFTRRRGNWFKEGDVVLLSDNLGEDYQILLKYSPDEVKILQAEGKLGGKDKAEDVIQFGDDDEVELPTEGAIEELGEDSGAFLALGDEDVETGKKEAKTVTKAPVDMTDFDDMFMGGDVDGNLDDFIDGI